MILKVLKKKLIITTFAHIQSHETQTLPWFEHKITLFKIRYKWCKQTCWYRRGRHKFQSWALKHWALGVINTRDMKVYFLGLKELTAWNKKCNKKQNAQVQRMAMVAHAMSNVMNFMWIISAYRPRHQSQGTNASTCSPTSQRKVYSPCNTLGMYNTKGFKKKKKKTTERKGISHYLVSVKK